MDRAVPHLDFWRRFLAETDRPDAANRASTTLRLGDGKAAADEAAMLVLTGAKTANVHLRMAFDSGAEAMPREGALTILEDGAGRPVAVLETKLVVVEKFADIDDAFARAFGEWGGSLKSWRRQCRALFGPRCRALGQPFSEETEIVCEHFQVIFNPTEVSAAAKRGR
jgi:uncharacterized protein YhfF